jgi:hypothetical protein
MRTITPANLQFLVAAVACVAVPGCSGGDGPKPWPELNEAAKAVAGVGAVESGQVQVIRNGDRWKLLRDGKAYLIRGVGGDGPLEMLPELGCNSVRTWGTDGLQRKLDEAQRHGLSVCVGIWLGHERHGFDYENKAQVAEQREMVRKTILTFKDHPAVLLWGLGNEMEGYGDGGSAAIWSAVNDLASLVKELDPKHPTMTVIAEIGGDRVKYIHECPDIDIVGINSYGGASSLPRRYREAGGTKPFILAEFGPPGPWEVGRTTWQSAIEPTSTEKAQVYRRSYETVVNQSDGLCLGSYAFLWGNKQETTATWFGMLLPDGSRLAATDAMAEAWTGSPPKNRCPRIESLAADRTNKLKPGEVVEVRLATSDLENDPLTIKWVLRYDSGTVGVGGDYQAEEFSFADAVTSKGAEATLTVPAGGGGYRLFAYVFDDKGGAAVANVPLYVDAPIIALPSPKARLPFSLYADEMGESPYTPSGYMGNTKAIRMKFDSTDNPHSGATCLKIEYQATDNWGGVLWQSPPNDWDGEQPGGLDLTGAGELEFWVRGGDGGEIVSFVFGVLDGDQPYRDSAKGELKDVCLTAGWQRLSIPLDGYDLSRIKTGFGWSLAAQGKPVTFYLDDIRYVAPQSRDLDGS